ncbi:MAG TPA: RNA polymerase sigma factor [Thermoanaerobaculia bacterium]|nr:RNA polymerase sigma factor [Thermoanaerobaculia bacterium]
MNRAGTILTEMVLTGAEAQERDAAPMSEEEFRAFYARNARRVWAYLARITSEPQVAEDLLQEAFFRFIRAGASHESEAHQRNSLYRIATNLARDHGRKRRWGRFLTLDSTAELQGASDTERSEGRTDLTHAMSRLRPQEREMLWLAYVQGSSHAEIAEILGFRKGSIKTLLFRARRRLAAILRGEVVKNEQERADD